VSTRRARGIAVRLSETVRQLGLRDACVFVASRLLATVSGGRARIHKYYFMAQPVASARLPAASPRAFSLAFVDEADPRHRQCDRPARVIAARYAQGARCLMATTADARVAGFLWYVVGPYDEDEVRARFCPLPAGTTAWDFDVEVAPAHRMTRLFSTLWRRAFESLAAQGVTHTVSRISAFNPPSLAAHRRLGATRVGSASFLAIGRLQLMASSVAPRWHCSWRDERRPVLVLAVDAAPARDRRRSSEGSNRGSMQDIGEDRIR
jgi:L-amino acid N-acyltransferase YncA